MKEKDKNHKNNINLKEAAEMMSLLSNPQRIAIVCNLTRGELSVNELVEIVGLSQSALSQHLAKLKEKGLIKCRREHNKQIYSVNNKDAGKIIILLRELYCDKK